MSSASRVISGNVRLPGPFSASVLTYDNNQVVPFTFNKVNGVIDFDFSGTFNANTTIDINQTAYIQGASFGALHVVNDIGPNIVAWCQTKAGANAGSVKIYEKPLIVRTNQISVGRAPNNDSTMAESDRPFDFDTATGNSANNFNATYLFKKPLVVTYTVSGTTKYRMFNTQFEGNV